MTISRRKPEGTNPTHPIDAGPQTGIKLQTWEVVLSCGCLLGAFALAVRAITCSLWMDEAATYRRTG